MTLDLLLFSFLNSFAHVSPVVDAGIVFLATYLPYLVVLAFLLLLGYSIRSRKEKFEIFWVTIGSALVARLGVTEVIRAFLHRPRPFLALGLTPLIPESSWSFPSGHAMFFFALSTAVYLYEKKWGIAFLVASGVIGLARVASGVHYPSDVVAGALLGALTAYLVNLLVRSYLKNTRAI